jgi:hypothetical protein
MKKIDLSKYDLTDPNLLVRDIAKMEGLSVSAFYINMKKQGLKIGHRGMSDKAKAAAFGKKTKRKLNNPFLFYMTRFFKKWRAGAKTRFKEFDLTLEDITNLWDCQNGMCALSNLPMKISDEEYDISLDRIDSSKGYINGNIQLVTKQVNYMKQDYTQEDFVNLCKIIAEHNA